MSEKSKVTAIPRRVSFFFFWVDSVGIERVGLQQCILLIGQIFVCILFFLVFFPNRRVVNFAAVFLQSGSLPGDLCVCVCVYKQSL